jgi:hypothetical protein
MKIMTSYFYQIRFFTPNMIPLSTAVWDPSWFFNNQKQGYQWKDKRGVWNGLRAEPFVPGAECNGLCRGPETCNSGGPHNCPFLKKYREQLDKLDYEEILQRFETLGENVQKEGGWFDKEPILVLIVHEAYDNPCSERWVIQDWFKDHGYPIEEFIHQKEPKKKKEQVFNF